MMSSRRMSKQNDDGEFSLECKAAFLSIYDDISDRIESKKALNTVLQQTGRNPSRAALNKYWTAETEEILFSDFVDICHKEPVTSVDDLMKAFRKIDINGDGYISLDELYKIMNSQGEKMSRDDVRKMIDDVDDNKDGRLDYGEFTNMIMKTNEDSKKFSMKVMEKKERRKKRGAKGQTSVSAPPTKELVSPDSTSIADMGSHTSLRSLRKELESKPKETKQLNESFKDSSSVENKEFGSKASLISAHQLTKYNDESADPEPGDKNVFGSKLSLKEAKGSRISLRSQSEGTRMGSVISMRSLKPNETLEDGSPDTKDDGCESTKQQRPGSASSQRSQKDEKNLSLLKSKDTIRKESSAKMDSNPKPETPKAKDIRPDIPQSPKRSRPQTPKDSSQKAKTGSSKEPDKVGLFKLNIPQDSARSVGEEIEYDDDFDVVNTGRPTPRIDLKTAVNQTPRKDVKDENGFGSQASLRSGEISAPVPSARKSSSRLSEDDVPKPSPRVTVRKDGSKGKSLSTKSKDKLPDPKSLKDWIHCTSKGCFFYEEDEIVTHVYNLKLTEDSTVFLSAYPIQEPACLSLPGMEPVDTALYVFDNRGKLVTFAEERDIKGKYGVKCELSAGEYQVLPYTTGCRFKLRSADLQDHVKEAKLVKRDKEDKIAITSAFRRALEDIFDLCDLDNNGTMSKDEFNWFNLRTSGEELGEDEWEVVEERTSLEEGEITKAGFIELNVMEAEDANGDVEDLWITLNSMGLNKALIMDEACPFRLDVYVEESGRRKPSLKVTGIESLDKKEFVQEICLSAIEKASDPVKIRNMKDLYMYTYRSEFRATIVIDNRSRSSVSMEVDCSKSKNVASNREGLDHTFDIDPQQTAIAHHLMPKSELNDWTVNCTETIHK